MTIGIDIDNTITNTEEKCYEYVKRLAPNLANLNLHDLNNPDMFNFYTKYLCEILQSVTLKRNAKEVINYLHENGFKIVLITARGATIKKDLNGITKNYLKLNEIYYDKLVTDSLDKGKDAYKNQVDYFIDDEEFNLDNVVKYNIKCFKFANHKPSKYLTFNN